VSAQGNQNDPCEFVAAAPKLSDAQGNDSNFFGKSSDAVGLTGAAVDLMPRAGMSAQDLRSLSRGMGAMGWLSLGFTIPDISQTPNAQNKAYKAIDFGATFLAASYFGPLGAVAEFGWTQAGGSKGAARADAAVGLSLIASSCYWSTLKKK
jgi:hypothetical protein